MQQRLETLFDYFRGENSWISPTADIDLYPCTRFQDLETNRQLAIRNYEVPVAYLRHYDSEDIENIFLRVQFGMALTAGEKIKNGASPYRELIREITTHSIFATPWGSNYKNALHWMLSTSFFMFTFRSNPRPRVEYKSVSVEVYESRSDDLS